jgi:amidase
LTNDEYLSHDATALAELVRGGEVTPMELLEIALARVHALDPKLNAIVRSMETEARRDAARPPDGPFAGVPFLVKDIASNYAGHPTSGGSRLLADVPMEADSELAARVRATGVSILGKTNLPEWGLLPVTESALWGACRNPWAIDRTPGGSSGGAAAAVAAGMVPMAGGSDGGGSIRIPASCCGLFGLKPTRARTPTGPDRGQLWRGATVEHVLTRSVRDSARMLDATHGPDVGAPVVIPPPARPFADEVGTPPRPLRIAWTTEPIIRTEVHRDCVRAAEDAAALLEELGHELEEDGPPIDGDAFARSFLAIIAGELAADLDEVERMLGRKPRQAELEPATWALGLAGRSVSARDFAAAIRHTELIGRAVGGFFQRYDLLLTPTLSRPPVPIGAVGTTPTQDRLLRVLGWFGSGRLVRAAGVLDEAAKSALDFTPWTAVFNATGQPAMSVPLHWNDEDVPIGVHLAGRFGDEATLLRLAGQLEEARPWFDRLPPLAHSVS